VSLKRLIACGKFLLWLSDDGEELSLILATMKFSFFSFLWAGTLSSALYAKNANVRMISGLISLVLAVVW
jgi:hypothetical protein